MAYDYYTTNDTDARNSFTVRVKAGEDTFWADSPRYDKMTRKAGESQYRKEALRNLRRMIRAGDTIYCDVKSVSQSGMSRRIACYIARKRGEIVPITHDVATAIDAQWDSDNRTLRMDGCGMDMCFETVYQLGNVLWPNGTPKPHGTRNGEPDHSGGYALKYRSL